MVSDAAADQLAQVPNSFRPSPTERSCAARTSRCTFSGRRAKHAPGPVPRVPKPRLLAVWLATFSSVVSATARACRPAARCPVNWPARTSISPRLTASLSRKSLNRRVCWRLSPRTCRHMVRRFCIAPSRSVAARRRSPTRPSCASSMRITLPQWCGNRIAARRPWQPDRFLAVPDSFGPVWLDCLQRLTRPSRKDLLQTRGVSIRICRTTVARKGRGRAVGPGELANDPSPHPPLTRGGGGVCGPLSVVFRE